MHCYAGESFSVFVYSVKVHKKLKHFCRSLRYYEQDLALAKDLQDKLAQAKAYCNLGLAHKALGEYSRAEECQRYLLSLAQALDNTQVTQLTLCSLTHRGAAGFQAAVDVNRRCCVYVGQQAVFRAYGNLGDVFVCRGDPAGALKFYQQQLAVAQKAANQKMEADAYAALGSVHR